MRSQWGLSYKNNIYGPRESDVDLHVIVRQKMWCNSMSASRIHLKYTGTFWARTKGLDICGLCF